MADRVPFISITLLVGIQRARAERALAGILAQQGLEQAEVLLFDTAHQDFAPLAGSRHPAVQVIPIDAGLPLSRMHLMEIERARGQIVAFTEDHVLLPPGWLATLISQFQGPYAAVGGEPLNLNAGRGLSDLTDLVNYRQFHGLSSPQLTTAMPGHNSAYRRDVLLSFGEQLHMLIGCEPLLCEALTQRGYKMLLHPGASYYHENLEDVSMIFQCYYHWNRCFGHWRAQVNHWTAARRALQILMTPLIPLVRYFKLFAYLLRHNRSSLRFFLRQSPAVLRLHWASAAGVAAGCAAGVGDSDVLFGRFELNEPRVRTPLPN